MSDEFINVQVVGKKAVAEEVVQVEFSAADHGGLPPWTPGSHLSMEIVPGLERQYSLCGWPADELYTVSVLRARDSRGGSSHIHDRLSVGDVIRARPPRNNFKLVEASSYIFVAGGIGVTPLISMMRHVACKKLPWKMFYGGRSLASMAYADELSALGKQVDIVEQSRRRMIDLDAVSAQVGADTKVYCCGPEPLLAAMVERSKEWPSETLHIERFKPIEAVSAAYDKPFVVNLKASGKSILVGASETILDAMHREGVQAPSSCREGTCGTCETRILAGEADHRDSVLSPSEKENGIYMMICVSRAKTDELDLDA